MDGGLVATNIESTNRPLLCKGSDHTGTMRQTRRAAFPGGPTTKVPARGSPPAALFRRCLPGGQAPRLPEGRGQKLEWRAPGWRASRSDPHCLCRLASTCLDSLRRSLLSQPAWRTYGRRCAVLPYTPGRCAKLIARQHCAVLPSPGVLAASSHLGSEVHCCRSNLLTGQQPEQHYCRPRRHVCTEWHHGWPKRHVCRGWHGYGPQKCCRHDGGD